MSEIIQWIFKAVMNKYDSIHLMVITMELAVKDQDKAKEIIKIFDVFAKASDMIQIKFEEDTVVLYGVDIGATWAVKVIISKDYFDSYRLKDPCEIFLPSAELSKFLKLHRNENIITFKVTESDFRLNLVSEADAYNKKFNMKLRDGNDQRVMNMESKGYGRFVEINRPELVAAIKGLAPFEEHMQIVINGAFTLQTISPLGEGIFNLNKSSPLISEWDESELEAKGTFASKYLINGLSFALSDNVKFGFTQHSDFVINKFKADGISEDKYPSTPLLITQKGEGIVAYVAIAPRVRDTDEN